MELLGTFFLTLAVSFTSFTGNPIPVGLMFMAVIYLGFHISGAHYNPAVSFALFLRNRLALEEFFMYVVAQIAGALIALGLFGVITDVIFTPEIPTEMPLALSTSMEALLSFVLIFTILTVALLDRYKGQAIQGVIMGLTLIAVASIGGIFNPAIALTAMVINFIKDGAFIGLYPAVIYLVGPLLGGGLAAYAYGFFNEGR